jgi:predicted PurR-regulated permease PerM
MNFFLIFIFTFFIALERNDIRIFFYKIIPEKYSKYILKQEEKIVDTLSSWLKSQLIL